MNLHDDLAARWAPSPEQDAEAARFLADHDCAYTAHVLINKRFGWWTDTVHVEHLPGVFADREQAQDAAHAAAEAKHRETGLPVTAGWTIHRRLDPDDTALSGAGAWSTHWAVFEDILAVFPREERR